MDEQIEVEVELSAPLFKRARRLAAEMRISLSELFVLALRDFLARMKTTESTDGATTQQ